MRAELQTGQGVIKEVLKEDLPEVLELAASCPEAPAWPPEAWRSFVAEREEGLAVDRKLFARRSPDGGFSGLIAVTLTAGTTELELLLVHPARRRRGIGRLLAETWLQWAQRAGATEALLEVRASNAAAQTLYRELGLTDAGWRARYYHHPSEDALLMRRALGSHAGG